MFNLVSAFKPKRWGIERVTRDIYLLVKIAFLEGEDNFVNVVSFTDEMVGETERIWQSFQNHYEFKDVNGQKC